MAKRYGLVAPLHGELYRFDLKMAHGHLYLLVDGEWVRLQELPEEQ